MRLIQTLGRGDTKISVFEVSGKWILQFEQGPFFQGYKISHFDMDRNELFARIESLEQSEIDQIFNKMAEISWF